MEALWNLIVWAAFLFVLGIACAAGWWFVKLGWALVMWVLP